MLVIAPSTGWLYAKGIYETHEQEKILLAAGANGFEFCMYGWDDSDGRMSAWRKEFLDASKFAQQFAAHRSLHLPDVNNEAIKRQIAITQECRNIIGAVVCLTHPLKVKGEYPWACYEKMLNSGIPLAMENMDKQKDSGYILTELEVLAHFGLCFVLDVQHAFEHDQTMQYALHLFHSLQDKIAHFHVSGETNDSNHALLHKARNAKQIIDFLGTVLSNKKFPLIIEGKYNNAEELKQEIEFLRQELS